MRGEGAWVCGVVVCVRAVCVLCVCGMFSSSLPSLVVRRGSGRGPEGRLLSGFVDFLVFSFLFCNTTCLDRIPERVCECIIVFVMTCACCCDL